MGAFRPEDPRSPEQDKGYRLRDTDDRLQRMKTQAKEHHSSYIDMNTVVGNNGKTLHSISSFMYWSLYEIWEGGV